MKIDCGIIKDILPLYCDGVCGDESKTAVEEHLRECPSCKAEFDNMSAKLDGNEVQINEKNVLTAAANMWKKGRQKAFLKGSIIALLIVALAVSGFFAYHRFETADRNNTDRLAAMAEDYLKKDSLTVEKTDECGDYLAVLLTKDGERCMCLFERDRIFKNRFAATGGAITDGSEAISSYNMGDPNGNAVLVFFGENTSDSEKYYTFENNKTTYIRKIASGSFVDIFVIPDENDINSTPVMVDGD